MQAQRLQLGQNGLLRRVRLDLTGENAVVVKVEKAAGHVTHS
jgi:hypothetical protein